MAAINAPYSVKAYGRYLTFSPRFKVTNCDLESGHNIKYVPYVFTEHGVVMLANVLKSAVAVRASIQVVRAFVHLRRLLATNEEFARKIEALEKKVGKHDADLQEILAMLRKILEPGAK